MPRCRRPEQDPDRLSDSLAGIAGALCRTPNHPSVGRKSWWGPPICHRLVSPPVFHGPIDAGGDY